MQLYGEQVEGVVHADPDPQRDDGQGGHLHPDIEPDHEGLAQDGGDEQRYQRHQHRPPAAKCDQAQEDHTDVQQGVHLVEGFLHHNVGDRLDPRVACRGQELQVFLVVLFGERLDVFQDGAQRAGLVIAKVGHHREYGALGIEYVRIVDQHLRSRISQRTWFANDGVPLEVALEGSAHPLSGQRGEGLGCLYARHVPERPA
ncbi:hypothetical protein D9M68_825830 [compost metagenome]